MLGNDEEYATEMSSSLPIDNDRRERSLDSDRRERSLDSDRRERSQDEREIRDYILTRLKFISKIGENEKLDVSTMKLSEDNVWTSIWRTLVTRNESRRTTYNFIRTSINQGLTLARQYVGLATDVQSKRDTVKGIELPKSIEPRGIGETTTNYIPIIRLLLDTLADVKNGLNNLKTTTYAKDRWFVSSTETLCAIMETQLIDLEKKYEHLRIVERDAPSESY